MSARLFLLTAAISFTLSAQTASPPASQSGKPGDPAVLRLGQAVAAYEKRDFFTTVHLLSAAGQPPKLRDYTTYYLANAELMTNNGEGALRDLGHYAADPVPASPLAGRLTLLYAKVLLGQRPSTMANASKARQILETSYNLLPQPDGDFTQGQAFEATGFPRQAALCYQRVYFSYPASELSERARAALETLRASLGSDYPAPPGRQQLDRAKAFLTLKDYVKARQEYAMLATQLTGADRENAQSGVGASLYLGGDYAGALSYLAPLHPEDAEAGAQRLYYLTEAYRRANDDNAMLDAIHQLEENYPQSPWRLKALITAGNRYLLTQERAKYVPLYQAAANSFPGDSSAALCNWRVAWAAWLDRSPRRVALLKEQVEKFPGDTHVSDALFFLGRAAEQDNNPAEARAYFDRLNVYFPHYYYGGLARTLLADPKIAAARPDPAIRAWLESTADPAHSSSIPADAMATPNPATRQRIDRGRLLIMAGLTTQAVEELEYGAKQTTEQPTLLAMELSRSMPTPYLSVKIMKRFSGDYLSLPFEKASRAFWEMLFPMPYQASLTVSSMEHDLDPYAVAGLIRQESEFNPTAKSAVAYGLMQLVPATGRNMARQDGIRVSSAGMLFDPSLNIKLGTQYLRGQLNRWEGDWVKTLAAYNAGPERVKEWLDQFGYGDSAEFIENIPFTETRDYVQAVLRNGQVYRELYGKERAILASDVTDTSTVPPAQIKSAVLATKAVAKAPVRAKIRKTTPVASARKSTNKSSAAAKKGTAQKHAAA